MGRSGGESISQHENRVNRGILRGNQLQDERFHPFRSEISVEVLLVLAAAQLSGFIFVRKAQTAAH